MGKGLRVWLWISILVGGLFSAAPLVAGDDYLGRGADGCLMCHQDYTAILRSPHGDGAHPHSPFAEGQHSCESCHGPSASHLGRLDDGSRPLTGIPFGKDHPIEAQNAICLTCHEQDAGHHWHGSLHNFAEVRCADCHQVHKAQDPVMSRTGQMGVCLDCHQQQRSDMHRPSNHPMRSGQMVCTDCHTPHGGAGPAELPRLSVNESCYDCHAEKRGPFLWEHAPVAEDCTSCHRPHGSNHRDLLTARTPQLCQQCHLAQFHPSSFESGAGLPPHGGSSNMVGRDCMNCHTQVHGSNHPSGAGLTR
ncbi:DmsE family decaheme c-type cytochrome [Marinimicrobium alkaliphilum]|uniref:DmsE family decaheme c-type cytochrome n=1 Tax=Marinimicrobium alkaliphilum TaxID=2202654 RepID=UPI000DBA80B3|nr:DmsE family decaheme c-type cytochrome [Marinimicrobium alkaliphilum]